MKPWIVERWPRVGAVDGAIDSDLGAYFDEDELAETLPEVSESLFRDRSGLWLDMVYLAYWLFCVRDHQIHYRTLQRFVAGKGFQTATVRRALRSQGDTRGRPTKWILVSSQGEPSGQFDDLVQVLQSFEDFSNAAGTRRRGQVPAGYYSTKRVAASVHLSERTVRKHAAKAGFVLTTRRPKLWALPDGRLDEALGYFRKLFARNKSHRHRLSPKTGAEPPAE